MSTDKSPEDDYDRLVKPTREHVSRCLSTSISRVAKTLVKCALVGLFITLYMIFVQTYGMIPYAYYEGHPRGRSAGDFPWDMIRDYCPLDQYTWICFSKHIAILYWVHGILFHMVLHKTIMERLPT